MYIILNYQIHLARKIVYGYISNTDNENGPHLTPSQPTNHSTTEIQRTTTQIDSLAPHPADFIPSTDCPARQIYAAAPAPSKNHSIHLWHRSRSRARARVVNISRSPIKINYRPFCTSAQTTDSGHWKQSSLAFISYTSPPARPDRKRASGMEGEVDARTDAHARRNPSVTLWPCARARTALCSVSQLLPHSRRWHWAHRQLAQCRRSVGRARTTHFTIQHISILKAHTRSRSRSIREGPPAIRAHTHTHMHT